jgi:hypothetical protein
MRLSYKEPPDLFGKLPGVVPYRAEMPFDLRQIIIVPLGGDVRHDLFAVNPVRSIGFDFSFLKKTWSVRSGWSSSFHGVVDGNRTSRKENAIS